MRNRSTLLTSALVVLLLVEGVASFGVATAATSKKPAKTKTSKAASAVIKDCVADGKLNRKHSKKALAEALKKLPTDVREYSDCDLVIARKLYPPTVKRALSDCKDGKLSKNYLYSKTTLKSALKKVPKGTKGATCKKVLTKASKKKS